MTRPRSRFAVALIAAGVSLASTPLRAAGDDTAAVIQELRRRIEALEQQLAARPATPAPATPATTAATTAAAPAVPAAPAAAPAAANGGDFKLAWGGYIKADLITSRFSDGLVAQGLGRDAYIPNTVPVAATGTENARTYTDALAKETRLYLRGSGLMHGHRLAINAEFDFISGQLGQGIGGAPNEAVTNAYNPAFRLGYVDFDNLRIGQDWTTLQNLVALPDIVDLINWPGEGTVFARQPMIRYTIGPLALAIENGESTVAARGGNSFAVTDDNSLPDFVWRYTLKTAHAGDYTLSGVVRQIANRGAVGGGNDTSIGYGLSVAGRIPLWGQDDLRFTFSGGDGFGRYLALNTVGDAVVDRDGRLHTVESYNGFIAWHHPWNEQFRSNLAVSAFHANTGQAAFDPDFGPGVSRNIRSVTANLLYSPIPKLTFGIEYRHARRDTVGNLSGDLDRLQFSTRYNF